MKLKGFNFDIRLTVLWLTVLSGFFYQPTEEYLYDIDLPHAKGEEIAAHEDVQSRQAYEAMLLRNPQTGDVPYGIAQSELLFINRQLEANPSLRSAEIDVTAMGPVNIGGRTRAVAFDIRDENVILAGGVSGGIWKSTDGGQSWTQKINADNRINVTCLVQDTRTGKEDTWYYGTGELVGNSARGGGAPFRGDGVFKSDDNGETWQPILSTQSDPTIFNSQFQYVWDMVINPFNTNEDELLVGVYGGVLRSTDGGESWQVVLGQKLYDLPDTTNLNNSNAARYVSLAQAPNGVYYAALSTASNTDEDAPEAGVYQSQDGVTWRTITPMPRELKYRRVAIGINPSQPDEPYFAVDTSPVQIWKMLLNDGGYRAIDLSDNLPTYEQGQGAFNTQGSYNFMLKVHPTDPNLIFIGGTNLYRTSDGFNSTENNAWVGGYDPNGEVDIYPNHHPDQHALLFYPSNPDKILSANDGGLFVSENARADTITWRSLNRGYVTSQFYTIAQSKEAGSDLVLGGMQDNGTDIGRTGTDWSGIIGGDGGYVATTDDSFLWFASFQQGNVYRLTLDDEMDISTFARVDPTNLVDQAGSSLLFINPYALDPTNQRRMFFCGGNTLYLNENIAQIPSGSQDPTGLGWQSVDNSRLTLGTYTAIEVALDGEVAYAGTNVSTLKKLMHADSIRPQAADITSALFPEEAYISSVASNPADREHLVVVFSNYGVPSIFESTDGGQSFEDISGTLEEHPDGTGSGPSVRWAEIIPLANGENKLFVGTSVGLFATSRTQGQSTVWAKEAADRIGNAVVTMMDYRPADGALVIATHGNGVYRTDIQDFERIAPMPDEGEAFRIINAFPNPFSTTCTVQYMIPETGWVKIDLINAAGQTLRTLMWGPQTSGRNTISFDGNFVGGASLPNGVYFIRVNYEGQIETTRVALRR